MTFWSLATTRSEASRKTCRAVLINNDGTPTTTSKSLATNTFDALQLTILQRQRQSCKHALLYKTSASSVKVEEQAIQA